MLCVLDSVLDSIHTLLMSCTAVHIKDLLKKLASNNQLLFI